ncbi:hypothetical protein [Mycobacteroides abscessus]|uniref:TPR repeat region-containing protein n=1 Tax=Mycobacteroides abscessus TaxID=36809 RepID=UPI000C260776|nr:hypothetical protein [Mycobacteroides abscessus]
MTGLSLAQGRKFPELIHQFGQAAQKRALHTRNASDETEAIKHASTWEGEAGEVSREALGRKVTTFDASKVNDNELVIAAWAAELRATKVKQDIESAVQFAESEPYPCKVDEVTNTVSPPDMAFLKPEQRKQAEAKYVEKQNRILQVVAELEEANIEFANAIKMGTGGEIPPGVKEGSEDAQAVKKALAAGMPPPPEVLDRIKRITDLSPEQKKAWEAGKLTIPQSSMDYLNSFSRSMDGQNIGQLKDMMLTKVPESDARNMMNGFQMISDPKVQGADGRMKGSLDRLPDGMRNVANLPKEWNSSTAKLSPELLRDRQDLAAIVQKGSADFMHGSDLDRAMLKQTEALLDAKPVTEPVTGAQMFVADPAIQDMLKAAGRDNLAVHDIVAGVDGHTPNDKFIGNLLTHHYGDEGVSAGTLAHGIAPVANDTSQLGAATRAGETAHAFDQYIGNHGKELAGIENPWKTDWAGDPLKETFGKLNPELASALAEANDPFVDDLNGKVIDHTRGFEALDDPVADRNMPHTRDLMATINGDPTAAKTLHEATELDINQYQKNYTDSLLNHQNPDVDSMNAAGRLQGLNDVGTNLAENQHHKMTYDEAKQLYDSKAGALDELKKLANEVPGVKEVLGNLDKMPGDPLKDMLVGSEPTQADPSHLAVRGSEPVQYNIAKQLFEQGYGDKSMLHDALDQHGNLRSYEDFKSLSSVKNAITEYLKTSGVTGIKDYDDTYRATLPPGDSHTG